MSGRKFSDNRRGCLLTKRYRTNRKKTERGPNACNPFIETVQNVFGINGTCREPRLFVHSSSGIKIPLNYTVCNRHFMY